MLDRLFPHGSFARNVGVLAGGTAAAQAIMLVVLPVLTRLYSPSDFALLAAYSSLLGICAVVSCLRFNIAIPMPERDEEAADLFALAMLFAAITTGMIAIVTLSAPQQVSALLGQPQLERYLWLLPAGVFFASIYSVVSLWATRKKQFATVAKTRLSQAAIGAGTQLAMGFAGIAPLGLMLGHMMSSGAGFAGIAARIATQDRAAFIGMSMARMKQAFRAYDQFPKYSTFDSLANSASVNLPVLIIAALALDSEAGYLFLAMRVLQVPMSLVGTSISQVYLSRAPDARRAGTLGAFTRSVVINLAKIGIIPLLAAGIAAPTLFEFIFGAEWRRAGILVAWMTPWFIMQFLSSPISMVMHVCNRQRLMLVLTICGLALRTGMIAIAYYALNGYMSEAFAVSGAVFYAVCLALFLKTATMPQTVTPDVKR